MKDKLISLKKSDVIDMCTDLNQRLYLSNKKNTVLTEAISDINQKLYTSSRRLKGQVKSNDELCNKIDEIKEENRILKRKAEGLTFRLGNAMVEAKTFKGFINLPKALWSVRQDSKKQRSKVKSKKIVVDEKSKPNVTDAKELKGNISLNKLLELAKDIPESNGSQYYAEIDCTVAIVTDLFMFNYYNNIFKKTIYITPDNYKDEFENNDIDVFIYVSCWEGISNDEWRGIKYREKPKVAFDDILKICKEKEIKTVFQTIEDPSNYEQFLPIAKKFEYIFTSDSDKIQDYKRDCASENVFHGEFGANPLFNNPIGMTKIYIPGAFFAGSYPSRYKERCHDMEVMFDSIINSGNDLVVANRNSDLTDEVYQFPVRYSKYQIPKMEHKALQKVHKLFEYNINFNSIKHSPTMCAMRVYELQAQGSLIFSNYAKSVNNKFPNVRLINENETMDKYFKKEMDVDHYLNKVVSIRRIMNDKTGFDISNVMLEKIGFSTEKIVHPKILVVVEKEKQLRSASVLNQTYPNVEVVLKGKFKGYDDAGYVTFFKDVWDYESNYLSDMINGFKYTKSKYITKSAYYEKDVFSDGVQNDFTDKMTSKYRSVFAVKYFDVKTILKLKGEVTINDGYSIDPFELNYQNFQELNNSKKVKVKPVLSVIIPVYNNGLFLEGKCIDSLKRNEAFDQFELVLVDDGSDDFVTKSILNKIERTYENVVVERFPEGGSGSASRPRNRGLELASSDLITYLDPDNEISTGGYDALLKIYNDEFKAGDPVDMVSGYQMKVGEKSAITGRYTDDAILKVENPKKHFILNGKFPVLSTQAAVINKKILNENGLNFVEGSVGQDTLFGHELLCVAKSIAFSSSAHILYYADRIDSVTNVVGSRFFEKSLVLEIKQVERFRGYGVLDAYINAKFDNFFKGWYLEKLKKVSESESEVCRKTLLSILKLYGKSELLLLDGASK